MNCVAFKTISRARLAATAMTAAIFVAAASTGSAADKPRLSSDEVIYNHIAKDRPTRIIDVAAFLDRLRDPKRERKSERATELLTEWSDELNGFCAERGVNPFLAVAVIVAESNGKVSAESHAGAGGLMQLMPATAEGLSVADRKRAVDNIYGGCRYLGAQISAHGGDEVLALAAYNAGPGAVARHGGVPPYRETRAYIVRVARAWPERFEETGSSPGSSITFELTPKD